MPLVFLNGDGPNYTGFQFTTSQGLFSNLGAALVSAGWTVVSETFGVTIAARGNSIEGNFPCFIEFTAKVNTGKTNGMWLVVRGWHSSNPLTTASPDNIVRCEYIENQTNRLWLTLDQEAGCLCMYSFDASSYGIHFGFLNRVDPLDNWAYMVGYIHSEGYQFAYTAKSKHNNTNWRRLIDDYHAGTNYADDYQTMPTSCFDFMMRGKPYRFYSEGNAVNAFRSPWLGRLNYDNKPIIDPYYYLEGRGATTGYAYRSSLYFRGLVKYAYCGMSSQNPGLWCHLPENDYRIMSVGGSRWQAMRIA